MANNVAQFGHFYGQHEKSTNIMIDMFANNVVQFSQAFMARLSEKLVIFSSFTMKNHANDVVSLS